MVDEEDESVGTQSWKVPTRVREGERGVRGRQSDRVGSKVSSATAASTCTANGEVLSLRWQGKFDTELNTKEEEMMNNPTVKCVVF